MPASKQQRRSTTDASGSSSSSTAAVLQPLTDAVSRPPADTSVTSLHVRHSPTTAADCAASDGLTVDSASHQHTATTNWVASQPASASSDSCEPAMQADVRTSQTQQTRALPKKVYAYLGSAGAAASALGCSELTTPPAGASSTTTTRLGGTSSLTTSSVHDGPISHLRLMCSGLSDV